MRQQPPRIDRGRYDRVIFNPHLSAALLADLGYSSSYTEARAISSVGWRAYLPFAKASRATALYVPRDGRICRVDGDTIRAQGAIDLFMEHHDVSFPAALRRLEEAYLGLYPLSDEDLAANRKLAAEHRDAAALLEALRSARVAGEGANEGEPAERPGLQPGAKERDPVAALKRARERFAGADPDPGTGYLASTRAIDPQIVRRFGADLGRWAMLRYDPVRDEVMAAHRDAEGRFRGYEYRGGVTPANRRGSRGYAADCTPGLALLGDPATSLRLVVCESFIEALSRAELDRDDDPALLDRSAYLSCAGGPKLDQADRLARWATRDEVTVVLAYNADTAGDTFTAAVRRGLIEAGVPSDRITDLRPPAAADWNRVLKAVKGIDDRDVREWRREQEQAGTTQPFPPLVHDAPEGRVSDE